MQEFKSQTTSKGITYRGHAKCLTKQSDIDAVLNICRGARVQITGKNFEPDWGLFNGAVENVVCEDNLDPQLDQGNEEVIRVALLTFWFKKVRTNRLC